MVGNNKGIKRKWQNTQDPRGSILDELEPLNNYWKISNKWEGHKNNRDVGCEFQDTSICALKLRGDPDRMIREGMLYVSKFHPE